MPAMGMFASEPFTHTRASNRGAAGGEGEEIEAIADSIAGGHALSKHLGEMVELGVSDKEGLKTLVKETIETAGASDVRQLERGRIAYYNEEKNAVVIYDPNHIDKGTVLRPEQGRYYFDVVLK